MSDPLDYDSLRADTVRQVAKLMAASAITAPKSGGMLFIQGKHLFVETVIIDDRPTLDSLSAWMRARGKERRETKLGCGRLVRDLARDEAPLTEHQPAHGVAIRARL